jgi:hypothetical protein
MGCNAEGLVLLLFDEREADLFNGAVYFAFLLDYHEYMKTSGIDWSRL